MLRVKDFILEYLIRPMLHGGFTMNKIGFIFNFIALLVCSNLAWYLLLVNFLFSACNYFIVLKDYKSSKPELTLTEIEIEKRNTKIKKLLSKW